MPGPEGPEGPPGVDSSDIIPYASGAPFALYMDPNQHPYTVGFGQIGECPHPIIGGELAVIDGLLSAHPFFIARDMVITDMGFSMMIPENLDLGTASANVYAQVFYKKDSPSFVGIPETKVILTPALTGAIPKGKLFEVIVNDMNVPVPAGSRLMMIFHKDVTVPDVTKSMVAIMSGSMYIRSI